MISGPKQREPPTLKELMNLEIANEARKPFYEMSFMAREFLRANFENVQWYSTDGGAWVKPPFLQPGKMNKEAYRIPPEPKPIDKSRNNR